MGHSEEILDQSNTDTQWGNPKSYASVPDVKGLRWLHMSSFADCNTLFSLGLVLPLSEAVLRRYPTALASPTLWGLQHKTGFLSELHSMAFPVLHARISLLQTWPWWLSLTSEDYSTTPLLLYPSWLKSQKPVADVCFLGENLNLSLNFICVRLICCFPLLYELTFNF